MYVSIMFCKEGINGEVILMFITKIVIIHPFFVSKFKKFELVYLPGPLRVYTNCKCHLQPQANAKLKEI